MLIAELSHAAANAISSTSAIYDPRSVVKELLDNALDACATSISVDISQDALSILQVKDNGLGIHSGDRGLVCKPHHTSKIQSLEDLKGAGPNCLGFRGLALASIVEMSGGVLITTRTNADTVGSRLTYDRAGELLRGESVAHPTGTTVRVSDFLKYLPVRRKVTLKSSSKAIAQVKNLLHIYAMARPDVRFSLKVTGGRSDGDWIYAAKQGASVTDATLKVAGAEVASQCITRVAEVPLEVLNDTSVPDGQEMDTNVSSMRIVATLPRANASFSNISRCGQYISIDGRPLSSGKGIAKSLVKLYRSYIRSTLAGDKAKSKIVDPFLCIHISCPPGSYDFNVEPAKDDVILGNQPALLSVADDLFKEVYGDSASSGQYHQDSVHSGGGNCTYSFSREESEDAQVTLRDDSTQHEGQTSSRSSLATNHTLSDARLPNRVPHTEPLETNINTTACARRDDTSHGNANMIPKDPWTVTRLNGSPNNDDTQNRNPSPLLLTPRREGNRTLSSPNVSEPTRLSKALPSPSTSRCLPSPPSRSDGSPLKSAPGAPRVVQQKSKATAIRNVQESPSTANNNGTLDDWILNLPSQCSPIQGQPRSQLLDQDQASGTLSQVDLDGRFGRAQASHVRPCGLSQSGQPTPCLTTQPTMQTANVEGNEIAPSFDSSLEGNSSLQSSSRLLPSLDEALDFERRKKRAIQYQRGLRSPLTTTNGSNNARSKAVGQSSTGTPTWGSGRGRSGTNNPSFKPPIPTSASDRSTSYSWLHSNDPRAYYMRSQNSHQEASATNKLPLESIAEDSAIHHLAITLPSDWTDIVSISRTLSAFDAYVGAGDVFGGLSGPISSSELWNWKHELLKAMSRRCSGGSTTYDSLSSINLGLILDGHWRPNGDPC